MMYSDASRAIWGGKAPKEAPGVPGGGRVLDALAQLPDSVPYIANNLQMGEIHWVYDCAEVVYMYHLHRFGDHQGMAGRLIVSAKMCSASASPRH